MDVQSPFYLSLSLGAPITESHQGVIAKFFMQQQNFTEWSPPYGTVRKSCVVARVLEHACFMLSLVFILVACLRAR